MGEPSEGGALERAREAEGVRMLLRRELRHTPQRLLAALVGIDRNSLRKFLALSEPAPETWARLREWARDRPEPDPPPDSVALALLAAGFPARERSAVRRRIAETLLRLHLDADRQPPGWLVEESETA
jgi:hypothetical protein